ncbi:FAD-dependent monooxygenase [Nocardia sp. NPDC001965]
MPAEPPADRQSLRVACVGGGPGGLFTAIALAQAVPGSRIDVFERNRASDVFGFGVVFSDATLDTIDTVDPVLRDALAADGQHWDTISVRSKGTVLSAAGNGMAAIHRRTLLEALRGRATELGVDVHYETAAEVDDLDRTGDYDLIVAADGANSATRGRFAAALGHTVTDSAVAFIWFGTTFRFDGLTFLHKESEHGNFAVHAYPIGSGLSTFIVETDEETRRRAGLDDFDTSRPPGPSDDRTQRYLEQLFAAEIDGQPLVANNSRWANFRTRRTERWSATGTAGTPVVLLGDAVHTAHFSVGSGTKMAMEDAAALAGSLAESPRDIPAALDRFQRIRQPQVDRIHRSSVPSLSWWDHFGEYHRMLAPWQFAFHFFSRAISAEKVRLRDPAFVAAVEKSWLAEHGAPPLDTPLRIGDRVVATRLLRPITRTARALEFGDGSITLVATDTAPPGTPRLFAAPELTGSSLRASDLAAVDAVADRAPSAVVVHSGTALSRVLCAEHLRLRRGIPVVVADRLDSVRERRAVGERDCAATLVLAGRADAVLFEPDSGPGGSAREATR